MYNKMFAIKKHFILLWDYVRCKNWHLFLIGKSWYYNFKNTPTIERERTFSHATLI